ncbi:MAG TPA: DUF3341 domain-containing protein [Ardenticatenaceae bacterium]|nr:DUF3341 domain-containing protein [Ardenticatenaceae bacterium]
MTAGPHGPRMYGLMAEYEDADGLAEAIRGVRQAGYTRLDGYTPYPVHEVQEALGVRGIKIPLIVLVGGIVGAIAGFGLQYYAMVLAYPLNVGGRPLNSWPMWVPVTFETTVLFAALAAVFGMLAFNGLPQPYHPVFNVDRFALASRDRFFLVIETNDPKFDPIATRALLQSTGAREVFDVPE